jgi:NAD(P)-dependent dehydrogenase (short-subunit alcohol dehydrogenase family)
MADPGLDLNDRIALVTGAGSGIGHASALALAAAGAVVVAADLDDRSCRQITTELPQSRIMAVRCDVSNARQVSAMVDDVMRRFGRIDCLHNNAGIDGPKIPLHELDEESWDAVMDVNLRGAWLMLRHVLPIMYARGDGAVVNTASVAGSHGFRNLAAYCASKAGMIGLTRVAAVEAAPYGVRVNAVAPGIIATPLTGENPGGAGPWPSQRVGAPEEVAAVVAWLCSDDASYINGACIPIDGGWAATLGPRRYRRHRPNITPAGND